MWLICLRFPLNCGFYSFHTKSLEMHRLYGDEQKKIIRRIPHCCKPLTATLYARLKFSLALCHFDVDYFGWLKWKAHFLARCKHRSASLELLQWMNRLNHSKWRRGTKVIESQREANTTTNMSDVLSTSSMGMCAFSLQKSKPWWLVKEVVALRDDRWTFFAPYPAPKTKSAAPQKTFSEMDVFCIGYLFGVFSCQPSFTISKPASANATNLSNFFYDYAERPCIFYASLSKGPVGL